VQTASLLDSSSPVESLTVREELLLNGNEGYSIRGLPISGRMPRVSFDGRYLFYVPLQYKHYFIDLQMSVDEYQRKFSAKTRSTIKRKIRKYAEHCGGSIGWKEYKTPDEIREFIHLARALSKMTYQEKLLNAGIPKSDEFLRRAEDLASEQRVRGYILYDRDRPVSYLYCPAQNGVLIYAYLGYDPAYRNMSVGMVLHWLAVTRMLEERNFRYFDFTEGESEHKRLFATGWKECANIIVLKRTLANTLIVYAHLSIECLSKWLGNLLDRLGFKTTVKRILRFGRQGE